MAASDPTTRREAASTAARARVAAMTPAERRTMTAAARAAMRARDLAAVDEWARRSNLYPLPAEERERHADARMRDRARAASRAAGAARAHRAAVAAISDAQTAVDPSLAQMAARR